MELVETNRKGAKHMKLFLVEALILCAAFTAVVVPSVLKNPVAWAADYPPAVVLRCRELGLIPKTQEHSLRKLIVTKLGRLIFSAAIFAALVIGLNGADTFPEGFGITYGLWAVVAWYDALVLDCLWFCHDRRVRIPGTEDLEAAYHDYGFHIRMSGLGMVLGLPVALLVGAAAALI